MAQKASPDAVYPEFETTNKIPVRTFAKANEIRKISLSPDGIHILSLTPQNDNYRMIVEELEDEKRPENHFNGAVNVGSFGGAFWVNSDRLLYISIGWSWARNYRSINLHKTIYAFDKDGSTFEKLLSLKVIEDDAMAGNLIIDLLPNEEDQILISYSPDGKSFPGVYKLDIFSGETELVEEGQKPISTWISDHEGQVRLGFGVDDNDLIIKARAKGDNNWSKLNDQELFKDDRFSPINFGFDDHTMFVRSATANGRFSIYKMDLKTGKLKEKLFEHPIVDASDVVLSRSKKKVLAVTYREDKWEREFFDDDYKKLINSINKALPNRNNFIEEVTPDENYMLIRSISDVFPGAFYRMDVKGKHLSLIGEFNNDLNPEYLSPQKKLTYFARDGLEIPAYLTIPKGMEAKNLPLIVFPRKVSFDRNVNTYDYIVQFLVSRGYAVFQPNFRGATGYGFSYQMMGYGEWGGAMQNDIIDGVKHLISLGQVDKDRICIAGLSFGGYSALVASYQTPELFKCAASFAAVSDLNDYSKKIKKNYGKESFKRIVGDRKSRDIKKASPMHNIKKIKTPLLIFHGDNDKDLGIDFTKAFVKKLDKAGVSHKFVTLKEGDNKLSLQKNRIIYLRELEKFFRKHIGSGADVKTATGGFE